MTFTSVVKPDEPRDKRDVTIAAEVSVFGFLAILLFLYPEPLVSMFALVDRDRAVEWASTTSLALLGLWTVFAVLMSLASKVDRRPAGR